MAISEELKNARNTTSRRIVEEAKGIVRDRYMQPDLSLDTVCSELGVSNSYFSSLFKKETGKTFISWLTDYRMDHAADLMLEPMRRAIKLRNVWDIRMQTISVMSLRNGLGCHHPSIGHHIRNEIRKSRMKW
mgnify:CR=1 FL=1